jgi:hypothetical protein
MAIPASLQDAETFTDEMRAEASQLLPILSQEIEVEVIRDNISVLVRVSSIQDKFRNI